MDRLLYLFEPLERYENNCCIIWRESPSICSIFCYKDVIEAAKILTGYLNELGIAEYCKVLVNIGHSPALLPIILSVLNKRCCYCPVLIDEDQIVNHLILYESQCLISEKAIRIPFKAVRNVDVFGQEVYIYTFENRAMYNKVENDTLCYAIQTSGSTREPKIVNVPYSCVLPNIESLSCLFSLNQENVIFVSSPPTFDPFIVDIFLALRNGAAVLLVAPTIRVLPETCAKLVFNSIGHNATISQMTPSLFKRFKANALEKYIFHESTSLRILVLGGEPFPSTEEFQKWPVWHLSKDIRIFNIYGITEVSCWSSIEEIFKDKTNVSLGEPLDTDTQYVVRSTESIFDIISTGIGELYIESAKRKCFLDSENPKILNADGIISRKTGDLVEIKNNKILYRGRTNAIVKRYGCRVNLASIEEKVKKGQLDIVDVCCVFDRDAPTLVIFIILREGAVIPHAQDLFKELKKVEIPDDIVYLEKFPLSSHGKISRQKLLENYRSMQRNTSHVKVEILLETVESRLREYLGLSKETNETNSSVEKRIRLQSWKDLSFQDAGGSSFLALRLLSELEETMCQKLEDFFIKLLDKNCTLRDALAFLKENVRNHAMITTPTRCRFMKKDVQLSIIWKYDLNKCVDASPALANIVDRAIVVVGSHSHILVCLDIQDGSEISKLELPDRIEGKTAIIDECSIVGCYDGFLYKINLTTGQILQKFDSQGMIKCKPLIIDNLVLFANYSEAENLFCLEYQNFKQLWSRRIGNKSCFASAIELDERSVVICTLDGLVAAIEYRKGETVWEVKFDSPIFSTPARLSSKELVVAEVGGRVHCIQSGFRVCAYDLNAAIFSSLLALDSEAVIFGCYDNFIYCLQFSANDLSFFQKWKVQIDAQIYSTPTVVDFDDNYYIVACTIKGKVNIIHSELQCIVGSIQLDGEVFSSPSTYKNRIYIGCRDNFLYCLEINEMKGNKNPN
ncbi:beta-alanine-activating enzyme isoform X1 [Hermetia illucens]|nr:beta-alanine-activating enzyme isoform X1 [Hermetia illucens]